MNVIANTKVGKSWLVHDLAIAIATGEPWLGIFPTVQGCVLIIDNELHPETLASRLKRVAEARGVDIDPEDNSIAVWPLRGRLLNLHQIANTVVKNHEKGEFQFIIVDAFYRVLPEEADENSNGAMAALYNAVDGLAEATGAATALVHHASKGNQSEKSVTDVGSGAGAISRAADTHLILRRHQEENAFVLDFRVRSWEQPTPRCLRWNFPRWELAEGLDPADLWKAGKQAKKDATPFEAWTPERFADLCPPVPTPTKTIKDIAKRAGVKWEERDALLDRATQQGLLERSGGKGNQPAQYRRLRV